MVREADPPALTIPLPPPPPGGPVHFRAFVRRGIVHSVRLPTIPAFYMGKICLIVNIGSLHVQRIHRRNIGHGPPDRPFEGEIPCLADLTEWMSFL